MELNEYQRLAKVTENKDLNQEMLRLNYALGLGEAGELQNVVKKHVFHGHDEDATRNKVKDEAGDLLWYLAMLTDQYGITLNEVAEHNVAKLKRRYPSGFSQAASQNRSA